MNTITKADRDAADRLLKEACHEAVERFRVGQSAETVAVWLQMATHSADLLVGGGER